MGIPVDRATLAGLFASSVLYGMFLMLLASCLYVLLCRRNTLNPNYLLILAACLMLVVNTFILAFSFSRVLDAFIYLKGNTTSPDEYLTMLSQWKEVARTSACSFYIFVADLTLIYRCWIVWSRSFAIVFFPIMIHIAYMVTSIFLNVNLAHLPQGATIFDPAVKSWIAAALAISSGQNVIVTSLIAFKILSVNIRATGKRLGTLSKTVQIIVESGLTYVITVLVYLITYTANSNAQYVMIDILNPIIGITFSLLVVRVAMRRGPESSSTDEIAPSSRPEVLRLPQSVVVTVQQSEVVEGLDSTSDLDVTKYGTTSGLPLRDVELEHDVAV
ncbi:hypothetical protein DACRYDRAFT_103912 [Dacryopinax primogenitus]|uniref:Uncharacterized protein n=1 Tax=Dacryopinax primogenitus (strain DJM 731) TaxID=1858805 RepID=M5GEH4_DACPD|nr:uncharacterized protein DACRYDRAFT_103912 [Dacryopinax primogenitus]EJU05427.1 hypothetical protein DACRYDRAFT_103912 [Dacryopinax primogenitus]